MSDKHQVQTYFLLFAASLLFYLDAMFLFQVNYFPSRFDPVRHAERFPMPPSVLRGKRDRVSSLLLTSMGKF